VVAGEEGVADVAAAAAVAAAEVVAGEVVAERQPELRPVVEAAPVVAPVYPRP